MPDGVQRVERRICRSPFITREVVAGMEAVPLVSDG